MFCRYCGKEISDSAAFCPGCGKKCTPPKQQDSNGQQSTQAVQQTTRNVQRSAQNGQQMLQQNMHDRPPQKKRNRTWVAVAAICAVVLVAALTVAFLFMAHRRSEKPEAAKDGENTQEALLNENKPDETAPARTEPTQTEENKSEEETETAANETLVAAADALTEQDKKEIDTLIYYLFWQNQNLTGQVPFGTDEQIHLSYLLINGNEISGLQQIVKQGTNADFSITEENMELLIGSLAGDQAATVQDVRNASEYTYQNGQFSGLYADGDIDVYYPEIHTYEITTKDGNLIVKSFANIGFMWSYSKPFRKIETVLAPNAKSIFGGYSVVSCTISDLDRAVGTVTADSVLPDEFGNSYTADRAFDRNPATAWVEGADGLGVGAGIRVQLPGMQTVYGISVLPGYWKSQELLQKNGVPASLEITFSDGTGYTMDLETAIPEGVTVPDANECYQYLMFDAPVTTSEIQIRIKSATAGNTYEDVAISEIELLK